MIKAEFSASLLQSSVSHDPSEIILICSFTAQETFLLLLMLKTVNIFVQIVIHYISGFFDELKVEKNCGYLKYKSFITL